MKSLFLCGLAALLLSVTTGLRAESAASGPIGDSLKGNLVEYRSGKVRPLEEGENPLKGVKYYAYYYSASWCGPCMAFTPKLVSWYKKNRKKHPEFEIIFVSSDKSAEEMELYMKKARMPWPAVDYAKKDGFKRYAGKGIPCLVVVDENGTVLHHSYEGETYVGPAKVMEALEKRLKEDAKEKKS